jgi:hypothetical protein
VPGAGAAAPDEKRGKVVVDTAAPANVREAATRPPRSRDGSATFARAPASASSPFRRETLAAFSQSRLMPQARSPAVKMTC